MEQSKDCSIQEVVGNLNHTPLIGPPKKTRVQLMHYSWKSSLNAMNVSQGQDKKVSLFNKNSLITKAAELRRRKLFSYGIYESNCFYSSWSMECNLLLFYADGEASRNEECLIRRWKARLENINAVTASLWITARYLYSALSSFVKLLEMFNSTIYLRDEPTSVG